MMKLMQRFCEILALVLVGLLPFHALIVTVGTKLLLGPGHAPMAIFAAWKEAVLGAILLIALVEFIRKPSFKTDLIDWLIIALVVLSLLVPIFNSQFSILNFFLGFKYDFISLLSFLILRRVPWSESFMTRALKVLLWAGAIVSVYGILTLFLPAWFFTMLGYSDAHSLYLPNAPLAAFQQISGSAFRRIQSPMSGPNQFGIWLLFPISICAVRLVASYGFRVSGISQPATRNPQLMRLVIQYLLLGTLLATLFLTFSRSAWIAAFIILLVLLGSVLPRRALRPLMIGLVGVFIVLFGAVSIRDPAVFFRLSSDRGHFERPIAAIQTMIAHPIGLGLGSAGPASNRIHEACVFLEPNDDPSWAKSSPSLCVFVGKNQVQPSDHVCDCPFLTENWYLQIGVELGLLGFLIYLALIAVVLARMKMQIVKSKKQNLFAICDLQFAILLTFIGISTAALFLHAWEDAAVAYTGWVLIATVLAVPNFVVLRQTMS